ncbi:MAG TPA: hypothetical protein VMD05_08540, partial [Candidatus Nanoarchaeia archaeon]|nr:hypothetical protein [Candidatus Nanoarchaeia archaeon]
SWWVSTKPPRLVFPYLQIFLEYFKSVNRAPLKWRSRQLCREQIIKWFFEEGWSLMLVDLGLNLFGHSKIYDQLVPIGKMLTDKVAEDERA